MGIVHRESPQQVSQTLERIVGSENVCSAADLDRLFRHQMAAAISPDCADWIMVYPHTIAELAEVVTCAHQNRWRMVPCGSGSKLHWGGLASEIQVVVSTARLAPLVEHAIGDLTVTAAAGVRFADLQTQLARKQQMLALDPAYAGRATLGGIVATGNAGSLRQRYGGVRDMLIGISFVRADGQVANAGGRVVKNVAGYDLMKLLTGSYGTLGIISQLTFRVYPMATASQTVAIAGDGDAIATLTATLLASSLTPVAIDLLSTSLVRQLDLGDGLGLLIRFQGLEVSMQQQTRQITQLADDMGLQPHIAQRDNELTLWQRLREQIHPAPTGSTITCKIGVAPSSAASTLQILMTQISSPAVGLIHAASGLGILHIVSDQTSEQQGDRPFEPQTLLHLRDLCQQHSGFLSILAAPIAWKQTLDLWGYPGNALAVMQGIKQQFDPHSLLSPGRFVNGI